MNVGQDGQGAIHIRSVDWAVLRRLAVIFGVLLAVGIALAAYPFIQMFSNGAGSPTLVLVFLASMGVCFFGAAVWLQKMRTILDSRPHLTLTPLGLIYSAGGKARVELPWLKMIILMVSEETFQIAVPATAGPAGELHAFDIPLGGLERPGAEIAGLLLARAKAGALK
jgi:hypothetical protein